jgi:hypothetical protein
MKKFELQYSYIVEKDLKVNVCFKPLDDTISDFISTYITFENEEIAQNEIPNFIIKIRPVLFEKIQQLEGISEELKNQFEL